MLLGKKLGAVLGQAIYEGSLDKTLDQRPRLGGHVAILAVHRHGSLQPDDQVRDARRPAVGPVIAQDLVVRGIGKRDGVVEGEDGSTVGLARTGGGSRVRQMPVQTTLADIRGNGAVLRLDVLGPRQVSDQIGRFPLQHAEIVACCVRGESLELITQTTRPTGIGNWGEEDVDPPSVLRRATRKGMG